MAAKVVAWALRNRFLVVVLGLLVAAAGVEHMPRLPIDAVPDVTNDQVQVLTKAPALAPLEVVHVRFCEGRDAAAAPARPAPSRGDVRALLGASEPGSARRPDRPLARCTSPGRRAPGEGTPGPRSLGSGTGPRLEPSPRMLCHPRIRPLFSH